MSRGDRVAVGQLNLSSSMRQNYSEYGVEEYYKKVSATYRNPHYPGIRSCLFTWFNKWLEMEELHELSKAATGNRILVFDMACGSGEVTMAFKEWYTAGRAQWVLASQPPAEPEPSPSAPPQGIQRIVNLPRRKAQVKSIGQDFPLPLVCAADPEGKFTADAYKERTSYACATFSFKEISEGSLPTSYTNIVSGIEGTRDVNGSGEDEEGSEPIIEMVICSFALHLIQNPSELFTLLWELSTKARWLIILAPHKKPEIKEGWGWAKWNVESWSEGPMSGQPGELLNERVHCRVYHSTRFI